MLEKQIEEHQSLSYLINADIPIPSRINEQTVGVLVRGRWIPTHQGTIYDSPKQPETGYKILPLINLTLIFFS